MKRLLLSLLPRNMIEITLAVWIVIMLLLLAGCERPEVVEERERGPVATSMSCHKFGVCMTCMPGIAFDGKSHMTCAMKTSGMCPGSQPAVGIEMEQTLRYKSKPNQLWTRTFVRDPQPTGECQ